MKALFLAAEPGGATTLGPVAARLPGAPVYASSRAAPGFAEFGVRARVLPDPSGPEEGMGVVRDLLERHRPDVLVGSLLGPPETSLDRAAARVLSGLPTRHLAVLDSWMHLDLRFDRRDGRFVHLPDIVALPDGFVFQEMVDLGFPAERLAVTGHPFFDDIAPHPRSGVGSRPRRLGFLLQPLAGLVEAGHVPHPGYTETEAVRLFFEALELAGEQLPEVEILLREHPRRDSRYEIPAAFRSRVRVSREGGGWEFTRGLDAVAGMSGTLLVYSFLAGQPTVVCQPGLTQTPDPNILTRFGMTPNADTAGRLARELTAALTDPAYQLDETARKARDRFPLDGGNCGRILALMEDGRVRR
ncbi:MAG TPA: hypothetical protein PKB11_08125 [Desulfovibrio sp.]|uniref:hypothetical protein n=1 Tax=Desulfovibrio TaxID=872 RepID=UPI002D0BF637|nr:hypothetical protein [Desulfovibrio sp.]HMM38710.1 hypothetical protein [Desulfovibrio sp.]